MCKGTCLFMIIFLSPEKKKERERERNWAEVPSRSPDAASSLSPSSAPGCSSSFDSRDFVVVSNSQEKSLFVVLLKLACIVGSS